MRLFVALELPDNIITHLGDVQQRLRCTGQHPVKWVRPDTMHMTLHFLGDVAPPLLAPLQEALAAVRQTFAAEHQVAPPTVHLGEVGAFPNLRRPQVVWVGVGGDTATLSQIQQAVGVACATLGFPPEDRPFRAHLTLGRTRRDVSSAAYADLGRAIEALPPPAQAQWSPGLPYLFQSTLTPEGPIYTRIDDAH
ncbi:MAG: RNA 2',3'-cyclic phosphodiesterase [Chloroflexaceae bacterium]|nr:RNA 2',3'-cyclic phosphodiesterase [Chloroflexaceae bacterium]